MNGLVHLHRDQVNGAWPKLTRNRGILFSFFRNDMACFLEEGLTVGVIRIFCEGGRMGSVA